MGYISVVTRTKGIVTIKTIGSTAKKMEHILVRSEKLMSTDPWRIHWRKNRKIFRIVTIAIVGSRKELIDVQFISN